MMSLQGLTQSSDSVIIATKDAKRVLQSAVLSKQYENEIKEKDKQIETLFLVKEIKDSLISVKNIQIDNWKKLSDLNESNYIIEQNKRNLLQKDFDNYVKDVNKELKSVRRKAIIGKIVTGIIGAGVGITAGIFLIK